MTDNKVLELFGNPRKKTKRINWKKVIQKQWCPFASTKCFKVRKSQPEISIGTCTVRYGKDKKDVVICPNRLLERKQVFTDCVHLLTLHEPGNEFHVVPEVSIPGGSVDYFLVSAKGGKVRDFVAIEFQTLDTTGTVWPERQRALKSLGLTVRPVDVRSTKGFGMNWKMTAKTQATVLQGRETVRRILDREDPRLFVVIGPCSIHDIKAAKEYAARLKRLADEVGDSLYLIMRVYFEKPRTTTDASNPPASASSPRRMI